MTTDEIATEIRKQGVDIEGCVTIVRALANQLNGQQKGYMSVGNRVVCPVEMAVEQLDLCSDLLEETAAMRSNCSDWGTVEQDAQAVAV